MCNRTLARVAPDEEALGPFLAAQWIRSPNAEQGHGQTRAPAAGLKIIPGGTRTRNPLIRSQMPYPFGHRDCTLGSHLTDAT